ncbi:MAG: indole-3-glycerol phosphate synthase [Methanolobus sp.]|jgi:indole-3-glycerol phosphate synthase|uniref:indole-3-glycerol phosphate synthase TrpC n=1 Tax=Methanolobus sp. TaxID=1874737 RepID=UPI0024AA8125|nr:indole-3-glycerol-phosphate synthase [Methanolobus sp.]MDI3485064.1 indole-3-glycerol phosphate synthase [Methanolobus sp.]MDK2832783.1 indole-3-glycerol phosphate synthase [Methanolobus sp.]MDK2938300.1 indole-3-glycerol phosphate synthase [Methanolobus sp.]
MHAVINDIISSTEKRVQNLKIKTEPASLKSSVKERDSNKRDIIGSITERKQQGKVAVIAEVKPASPGKKLRDINPEDAAIIAAEMERAGAVAISVLTEPEFFHGSTDNLRSVRNAISLPVLRKDFIVDEIQFSEIESDLILLIAGILGEKLEEMVDMTMSKGFEPLVEVHNETELKNALESKTRIIGINNRNLSNLEIDLNTTLQLIPLVKDYDTKNGQNHIIISESGMHTIDDVRMVVKAGADAVLVGTSIIKSGKIYAKTKELVDSLYY